MGSIDKLTVTEQSASEAFKKKGDKVIVAIENEGLSDDSDEEPPFPYEHRGRPKQPAVGTDLRSTATGTKPEKQKDKSELIDEELDELDRRAMKANADKKKETTKRS